MKNLKYILSLIIGFALVTGCADDDNDLSFVDNVVPPSEVAAHFLITQDNTGLVTITPNSVGGVSYVVYFGDDSDPATVERGESVEHVYPEGSYTIGIEAKGITGLTTVVSQQLVVSFVAPENLEITAEIDPSNPFAVNVSATADYAASFLVYFDASNPDEEPTPLELEGTVSYEYPTVGDYTIKVVALSGGTETTEGTAVITVQAPTELPIDFEIFDSTVFQGFGGASNAVIDNPDTNGNPSEKVGQIIKGAPEVWAGNVITLSSPIDFSLKKVINLDVWSPRPGGSLLIKLENLSNPDIAIEKAATLNGNSAWENVSIDFTELIDESQTYQKIVFFFDIGTVGDGGPDWTFYIDNIKQMTPPSDSAVALLYDDFEGNSNITTWFGDACGIDTSLPNPFVNADNFSPTVLEYNDTGGQYANIQFTADSKFDLTGGQSVFALKIYVPSSSITGSQPNQVSLKLQNSDLGGNSWQTQTEIIKPIVLDEWQVVTFDFVNDDWQNLNFNGQDPDPVDRTDLDKVVIQVNSENNNDLVIAYIDDFYYGTAQVPDTPPFVRDGFEGRGTITTWLGDACAIDTEFANPFVDSFNTSPTVMQYDDQGGQYANAQFTVSTKFDLTVKSKFTLKIYVPSSSITGSSPNQISLKLQNSELGGDSWQTQTEIIKPIVLDQWQEITFDFVNDDWQNLNFNGTDPDPIDRTDLDKVVIQVNSENNNDLVTAYIDDLNYHN